MRTTTLLATLIVAACHACSSEALKREAGAAFFAEAAEPAPVSGFNTEAYDRIDENPFLSAATNPLSTFSIDVDTASYSNVRRFLASGSLPPQDAVRIEELVNYFPYAYAPPTDGRPFAIHVEATTCPWKTDHRLVRIGLKGREIEWGRRPPSNLVFLLDVSGSMSPPNKLPLLQRAMRLLVENLTENDRVAIAVYAGAAGLVLPSTTGAEKERIVTALDELHAGGSTNGGEGIRLAYRVATENFIQGGVNRVILATDGDFNVGTTSRGELTRLIEKSAQGGVFLTVLGFGTGNYKDAKMEQLADRGNGNYAYVDTLNEARKVLVEQASGTLVTIAKDVKIQVEFNAQEVEAYRLIGYENRLLRAEDFNDDRKDAGEIGAGHTVTALYEVVPKGVKIELASVDALKYGGGTSPARSESAELLTVKLRYKPPTGATSTRIAFPLTDRGRSLSAASGEFKFAAAVAAWGLLLRDSEHKGDANYGLVRELATEGLGSDGGGYRKEFLTLVAKARAMGR
ncbi:MAG: vWA domain-containing protein [Planctomycetota bacterium]|jgi:Ca-activated chloride channel family protein